MPMSAFGKAAFLLRIEEFREAYSDETLLPLDKDQIDREDLSDVIAARIAKVTR